MRMFKVICPNPKGAPGICVLYSGIKFCKGSRATELPHAEGCKCYLREADEPNITALSPNIKVEL